MKTILFTLCAVLFSIVNAYSQWKFNGSNIFPSSLSSRVLIGTKSDADSASFTINTNRSWNAYGNKVALKIMGYEPYLNFNDSNNIPKAYIAIRESNGGDFIISNDFYNETGRLVLRTYNNSSIQMLTNNTTRMTIDGSGNVGIGALPNASYKLQVSGSIRAKEVLVQTGWSDYVFDKNYRLPSLNEVENYINLNKHLPDVPSAIEIETNGLKVGQMDSVLIKKIEELTLYVLQLNEKINEKDKQINEFQNSVVNLQKQIVVIKSSIAKKK